MWTIKLIIKIIITEILGVMFLLAGISENNSTGVFLFIFNNILIVIMILSRYIYLKDKIKEYDYIEENIKKD
ncbi:MAG: hypothetical protein IJY25_03055 [Bacilli bacterium]|nr:hypothetical protein [Bacilli bacterium]